MSIHLNKTLSEYPLREKRALNLISKPVIITILTLFMQSLAVLVQGNACCMYRRPLYVLVTFGNSPFLSACNVLACVAVGRVTKSQSEIL